MLEQINLTKKLGKGEYKKRMDRLEPQLALLQRECKELQIPVMIVFEGFGAAGKGVQISNLIHALDPRGFSVYATGSETEEERMRPFLWRFWTKTPPNGRIAIFDRSWYRRVQVDRFDKITTDQELQYAYDEINAFEQQLSDGGTAILKLFLYIGKKEQKKRFEKLMSDPASAWRVSKGDLKRNEQYEEYKRINDEMLQKTDTDCAPWTIIESVDREFATVKIYMSVIRCLTEAIEAKKKMLAGKERQKEETAGTEQADLQTSSDELIDDSVMRTSSLHSVDLSLSYKKEEYKKYLGELQSQMEHLHGELYRRRIPVIIGFEGWDAGGKGGAIKRLTERMDPRGYQVNPTAAPNDLERSHHYLWRFWNQVPKDGHVAIYDRTWYGRVMVERIEGFCSEEEWKRAYKEINDMEASWAHDGAIVLKFWMQIDKDEQERRFKERMEDPSKQWKITDEDWRNREKWDLYEQAVDEMLIHTSTTYAPWIIVEGNCKYYARIKVLRTVIDAILKRLEDKK
ncbi:phosphate--AMP phosphotransferase [Ruminococcus gauvreauii]|uniref:Phosphate--AMP phosphotransferase n=1 Tax=Ruminococcus gauvreauii TaxID=438033 RepID=A0ABY5VGH9_9FIRM|nr:phosphate--AMP phosphotransferase [Ruminococcus gauvreauii]UWP59679.1 phosphate--AMP phosphotransferase [Ruminococcus gauvreauii]